MGHFYNQEGQPVYTVPRSDGKGDRPTRITDARKMGLVPSVTTITGIINKPQLIDWFKMQVLETCHGNPVVSHVNTGPGPDMIRETLDQYAERVLPLSEELRKRAADHGSAVHLAIENHLKREAYDPFYQKYVDTFKQWFESESVGDTEVEVPFTSADYGYGGRIDVVARDKQTRPMIIDIKTQKNPGRKKDGTPKAFKKYPEYGMQMAAYWMGKYPYVTDARPINFYIAADDPTIYEVYEIEDNKLYWEQFRNCQRLWNFINNWEANEVVNV